MDINRIDAYLQGASLDGYQEFGAHFSHEYDQDGARFTVYAPNASRVMLIGSFNGWTGYDMERLPSGVWTIFVQGIQEMDMYKYRIFTASGEVYDRADPFAFYSELRPNTASYVYNLNDFPWADGNWMRTRNKNYNRPLSIYEAHAGSWRIKDQPEDKRFYQYDELAELLIPYVKEMGYTHIELLPLTEHPFDGSWGYQVTGYFSATSRYGNPKQLMHFVNRCHEQGIGVIMDFVPTHFVSDFYALHQFDGGFVYESEYEDQRYSEWGTVLFDFSKPHVISFLRSAVDFWLTYYHFDGVRYDAVANLIYRNGNTNDAVNESGIWFLKTCNYAIQKRHPNVMLIAEDSSNYLKVTAPVEYGGLGFDYKWDLGWMNDTLDYLSVPPAQRPGVHTKISFSMSYFYNDIYLLPFSHDEVVHGKKTIIDKIAGNYEEKFHQLRTLYLYMFTHPGKKLNFMGNELAEFKEWDEKKQLGWNLLTYPAHDAFWNYFRVLQHLYLEESALYQEDYNAQSFQWLDVNDASRCVFAYKRSDLAKEELYIAINFSNRMHMHYPLMVDHYGVYAEMLNTDALPFGGKGKTNEGELRAQMRGGKYCLDITLAPFASCIFKRIATTVPPTRAARPGERPAKKVPKKSPPEELEKTE